jgi:hypothetical protein
VRRTYARIYLISNASAPGPGSRRANAVPVNQHLTGVGASMARQRKDRLVQLQSAQCALCGITLPISLMMPDGGQACADIRWYCKDARSCTERWTARLPGTGHAAPAPSAAEPGPGPAPDPVTAEDPVPAELLGIPGKT